MHSCYRSHKSLANVRVAAAADYVATPVVPKEVQYIMSDDDTDIATPSPRLGSRKIAFEACLVALLAEVQDHELAHRCHGQDI